MKNLVHIYFLFLFASLYAQVPSYDPVLPLEDYNFVLGTNGIAGKYQFSDESKLIEISKHIRAMGSNILKISLGKKSPKAYGLPVKNVSSTLELFNSVPDYKQSFDMDFKYIFAWVHTCTNVKWKQRINKQEEKVLYDEMFEFASYLLKEYSGTGKVFMIGNWEGDWLLHANFDRHMTPPKEHVKNMTKWFKIRQRAIDDARKQIEHKDVEIYHYVEVNLVTKAMEGKTAISSKILPNINPDLVSYSSYEVIKNKDYAGKKAILNETFNYIESQLKPKDIPFSRRVYLGEYGYHANETEASQLKQFNETKDIMLISLELNLPFALHWQMYNNEYNKKSGASKNMSLINEKGEKRALYYLHQNYYKEMNAYLESYKTQNNSYPSTEEFKKKALEVLAGL